MKKINKRNPREEVEFFHVYKLKQCDAKDCFYNAKIKIKINDKDYFLCRLCAMKLTKIIPRDKKKSKQIFLHEIGFDCTQQKKYHYPVFDKYRSDIK